MSRTSSQREHAAEQLIAHKLITYDVLVAKPLFDIDGADLLGFCEVKDGARFCRIQSKGRSVIKSPKTIAKTKSKYVQGAYIVFVQLLKSLVQAVSCIVSFAKTFAKYGNSQRPKNIRSTSIGIRISSD